MAVSCYTDVGTTSIKGSTNNKSGENCDSTEIFDDDDVRDNISALNDFTVNTSEMLNISEGSFGSDAVSMLNDRKTINGELEKDLLENPATDDDLITPILVELDIFLRNVVGENTTRLGVFFFLGVTVGLVIGVSGYTFGSRMSVKGN